MIDFKDEIVEILNDRQFLVLPEIGSLEISYPDISEIKDLDNVQEIVSINGLIDQDPNDYLFSYIADKTGRTRADISNQYLEYSARLKANLEKIDPDLLNKDGVLRVISKSDYDFLNDSSSAFDEHENDIKTQEILSEPEVEEDIPAEDLFVNREEIQETENNSFSEVEQSDFNKTNLENESPLIPVEQNYEQNESEEEYYERPKRRGWWALVFTFLVAVCLFAYFNPEFIDEQINRVRPAKTVTNDSTQINHYFLYVSYFNDESKAIEVCKFLNSRNIDTYVVQVDSMFAIKADYIDENQAILVRQKVKNLTGLNSEIIVDHE